MKTKYKNAKSADHDYIINLARNQYQQEGECEIDNQALVSKGKDNGAYVQAWVWVDFAGTNLDKNTPRIWRRTNL